MIDADVVLVAVGRRPDGWGLEALGVALDRARSSSISDFQRPCTRIPSASKKRSRRRRWRWQNARFTFESARPRRAGSKLARWIFSRCEERSCGSSFPQGDAASSLKCDHPSSPSTQARSTRPCRVVSLGRPARPHFRVVTICRISVGECSPPSGVPGTRYLPIDSPPTGTGSKPISLISRVASATARPLAGGRRSAPPSGSPGRCASSASRAKLIALISRRARCAPGSSLAVARGRPRPDRRPEAWPPWRRRAARLGSRRR